MTSRSINSDQGLRFAHSNTANFGGPGGGEWGLRGAVASWCLVLPWSISTEVPGQNPSSSITASKKHLGTRYILWDSSLYDSHFRTDTTLLIWPFPSRLYLWCGFHSQRKLLQPWHKRLGILHYFLDVPSHTGVQWSREQSHFPEIT